MEVQVYYAAYGKRLKLGVLQEVKGNYVFKYDEEFTDVNVHPLFPKIEKEIIGDAGRLPCLFWDFLPSGYNEQILSKIRQQRTSNMPLDKQLVIHNRNGIGALEFEPFFQYDESDEQIDLNEIAEDIREMKNLDRLQRLAASVNGHTPKVVVFVSDDKKQIFEHKDGDGFTQWIIKIPVENDSFKEGVAEYIYNNMAKIAGIKVSEASLFSSKTSAGYFGIKRFDRINGEKVHVLSACAMMNKHYLHENITIEDHINVVKRVAPSELPALMRLIIFNLKTGNNDMRGTNISFVLDKNNEWKLAPAYDLIPYSEDGLYKPKMLQPGYDKNEEDGKIYDLCEEVKFDFEEIPTIIEQVDDAIAEYYRLSALL